MTRLITIICIAMLGACNTDTSEAQKAALQEATQVRMEKVIARLRSECEADMHKRVDAAVKKLHKTKKKITRQKKKQVAG